jgi:hypothetical protein
LKPYYLYTSGDSILRNEKVENVHFVQIQKSSGEEKHGFLGRQGRKIHFVHFVGRKKDKKGRNCKDI